MKRGLTISSIVISLAMIGWLVLSAIYKDCFWGISFSEWIKIIVSIALGYIVAYILVEKNNRRRLFDTNFVNILERLIKILDEDCKRILSEFSSINWKTQLLVSTREVSNYIELLNKFAQKKNIEKEVAFIREQYAEYRTIVTECIDKLRKDANLRQKATSKLGLMITKISEIELKIFDN